MHGIVRTAASAAAEERHDLVQIRLPVVAEGR
jgi:predicted secreted protein